MTEQEEYRQLVQELQSEKDPKSRAELKRKMRELLGRLFHINEAEARFLDPERYDQWKQKQAGVSKPYDPYAHMSKEEKEAIDRKSASLPKAKRNDPKKNPNLFPPMEVIQEKFD